jgi:hypothetical protein
MLLMWLWIGGLTSVEFRDLLHKFVVPVLLGFVLTLFKITSELKKLENNEWSGVALDLVLVSIGSFTFYMRNKDIETVLSAATGNVVVAGGLLYWRYRRAMNAKEAGKPGPDQIQWYWAFLQLALGIGAFVWTIKAV